MKGASSSYYSTVSLVSVLSPFFEVASHILSIQGITHNRDRVQKLCYSLGQQHLKRLDIEQAEQVQVVAEGVTGIWNRVKQRLLALGVSAQKIVETVDFYHASEYLHKIVAGLHRKLKKKASGILQDFKQSLWEGNIESIVEQCGQYFSKPSQEISQYINYLDKNTNRIQYQQFRNQKLVCGSGVIESGIRRVINLRFKNASAFWNPKNVESLYFLRATLLAFRWNTLIDNLVAA